MSGLRHVLVVGGAGYVGSMLVPQLLAAGYRVTVLDLYLFGEDVLAASRGPNLTEIKGDVRDADAVARALLGCDSLIHLACLSNDPSFDAAPELGRAINYDSFPPLVEAARRAGIKRFVFASSSSVYGLKDVPEVHEDLPLEPLTEYSRLKVLCEQVLTEARGPGFETVIIRPATVCGYAPRLRLDVIVNILTNHAFHRGKILVLGGSQLRPNIHVLDMCRLYLEVLAAPAARVDGRIWNAGHRNHSVLDIAGMVRDTVGGEVAIEVTPTDDNRSYHVSSERVRRELGFEPRHSIADAVLSLTEAFARGAVPDPLDNEMYFNVKRTRTVRALIG